MPWWNPAWDRHQRDLQSCKTKEIQPVHCEGDQPWDFFEGNDAKAETLVLWPPHAKSWLIRKDSDAGRDWRQEEEGTTEDEMAGWHHWLDGHEFEWTPGDGHGQGGLACWGCKEPLAIHGVAKSQTQLNDWTELNWKQYHSVHYIFKILENVVIFYKYIYVN